jgi:hypothetical protein
MNSQQQRHEVRLRGLPAPVFPNRSGTLPAAVLPRFGGTGDRSAPQPCGNTTPGSPRRRTSCGCCGKAAVKMSARSVNTSTALPYALAGFPPRKRRCQRRVSRSLSGSPACHAERFHRLGKRTVGETHGAAGKSRGGAGERPSGIARTGVWVHVPYAHDPDCSVRRAGTNVLVVMRSSVAPPDDHFVKAVTGC